MNLYIGGTFVYHLGTKIDLGPFGSVKYNVFYLGPEVGYDVAAGPVVIRPYAGIGYATAVATAEVNFAGISASSSTSQSKFSVWPGATLLYPLGGAFIGADARFVLISGAKDQNGDQFNAFSLFATGGMQF